MEQERFIKMFLLINRLILNFGQHLVNTLQKISLCLSGILLSYFYSEKFDNGLN